MVPGRKIWKASHVLPVASLGTATLGGFHFHLCGHIPADTWLGVCIIFSQERELRMQEEASKSDERFGNYRNCFPQCQELQWVT